MARLRAIRNRIRLYPNCHIIDSRKVFVKQDLAMREGSRDGGAPPPFRLVAAGKRENRQPRITIGRCERVWYACPSPCGRRVTLRRTASIGPALGCRSPTHAPEHAPKGGNRMRRAILLVLLSFCVLALPAGPARADYGSDRKAYDALRRANAELEKTKPEQAVTAYRTFLEAHPDLHPKIGVDLTSTTADLLYSRLKQTDKALQICDWAIETYRESRCMVESLTAKAQVLNAEKRWAEAQLLLEKEWDRVMAADQFRIGPAVQQLVAALDAQGKRKEATETTYKALSSNGDLLSWWWYQGTPPGWMYDRVLKDLVAKNRLEEALSWAKLIFMVCGSTPNEINAAMGYLDRVWNLKDLSDRTFKAFQAAARTPANPNPLDQVKLPELNLEAMNAHADRPVDTAADLAGIIGAQIATGRMREAVVTAQEWYGKSPDAFPDLIKRVLKAGFLNTKVMEECAAFRKTAPGPTPMEHRARSIAAEASRPAGDKTPPGGDQKILQQVPESPCF